MLNLVNVLDNCNGMAPVIKFIKEGILPIIQIGIPIVLILMGSIDLGKAVMSSDDKEIKGATSKLIKRAIAAVAIFFIPFVVNLLIGLVSKAGLSDENSTDNASWATCWTDPE